MAWEELFQKWDTAILRKDRSAQADLKQQAITVLSDRDLTDIDWLLEKMEGKSSEDRHWSGFICSLLRSTNQMPDLLIEPLLKATFFMDPSSNQWYIAACMRSVGRRKVNEILLRYLETGTDAEKRGAANGLYWSTYPSKIREREHLWGTISDDNMDDFRLVILKSLAKYQQSCPPIPTAPPSPTYGKPMKRRSKRKRSL